MYLLFWENVLEVQVSSGDSHNRSASRRHFSSLPKPREPDTCKNKHKHSPPILLATCVQPHLPLHGLGRHLSRAVPAPPYLKTTPARTSATPQWILHWGECKLTPHTGAPAIPTSQAFSLTTKVEAPAFWCVCNCDKETKHRNRDWLWTLLTYVRKQSEQHKMDRPKMSSNQREKREGEAA